MSQDLKIKRENVLNTLCLGSTKSKTVFKYFGKNTFGMCLLTLIPGHSVVLAEGYQEEGKVNSVFQIVGRL